MKSHNITKAVKSVENLEVKLILLEGNETFGEVAEECVQ